MSKKKILEELIEKHQGVITSKQAGEEGIHREYLREFVEEGYLERVSHGVYISPEVWQDQMMILQLRKDKMIYSHETALFLHDLTDRDPIQYVVTVTHGYNPTKLKKQGLVVHTVKRELFIIWRGQFVMFYGTETIRILLS